MQRSKLSVLFALITLVFVYSNAGAYDTKVYKWKDSEGIWHYDVKPPKNAKAQTVSVKPATASQNAAANATGEPKTKEMKPNSNCDRARESVSIYENNRNVSLDSDGDGTPEPLDESQQIVELERARKLVDAYCK
jgi:hypothetical protein